MTKSPLDNFLSDKAQTELSDKAPATELKGWLCHDLGLRGRKGGYLDKKRNQDPDPDVLIASRDDSCACQHTSICLGAIQ